ncbi:hypothetical protein IVA89_07825 [Bradyrhizobium sp. 150]|nr:hypothetical protein [Bradyrhizobium sp. 150]
MSAMKGDAPMNLVIRAVAKSFGGLSAEELPPMAQIRAELDAAVEEKRCRLDLELMSACRCTVRVRRTFFHHRQFPRHRLGL